MISTLIRNLINMFGVLGVIPLEPGRASQAFAIAGTVPQYTLTPRFITNIRELYDLETQCRLDYDIDWPVE